MNLIKQFITQSALDWSLQEKKDSNSIAGYILTYIESQNKLRDAQIEALKVYLWLKCVGENRNLVDLLKDFYPNREGSVLKTLLIDLGEEIDSNGLKKLANTESDDQLYKFFVDFFGGYENVSNFLFSLPMGAGKTFVMASMIYIDLYFNLTTNDNRFAKNFLIFAPSGLKKSVIPSLRSIERFDPTWILPSDIALQIKKQLSFMVLDVNKTEKKSNRTENPNARKVQECLTKSNPSGYIFVTNAEKVILDKIVEDPYKHTLFEQTEDEKSKQANELRHLLGKVPNLTILIDEVHHTQKDENKLKLVLSNHLNQGNTVSIIGFTGTPYFKRKITLQNNLLQLDQIPNTVYTYDLKNGVRNFLKQPLIKQFTANSELIIRSGLEDFYNRFYSFQYKDGRKPKLAIYCSNIDKLEEEVLPIVTSFFHEKNLDTNEIFKYYSSDTKSKTGKKYKLDKGAEIEFSKLDSPYSQKRIILLVQIGKEGWDCQSLSGVILSGEGDSPKNMVLQTSCRCLREVDDATNEIGLIYLNNENYKHLEKELKDSHKISIKEFEEGKEEEPILKRVDRREYLQLPLLSYNQFVIQFEVISEEGIIASDIFLEDLINKLHHKEKPYFIPMLKGTRQNLDFADSSSETVGVIESFSEQLSFSEFKTLLLKSSLGLIENENLALKEDILFSIYSIISKNGLLNHGYDIEKIVSSIHASILPHVTIKVKEEINPQTIAWLVNDINKNPTSDKSMLYPNNPEMINNITTYDSKKINIETLLTDENRKISQLEETKKLMAGNPVFAKTLDEQINVVNKSKLPLENKDNSFHYLPYDFTQSNFEQTILENIFQLDIFKNNKLEVYFNGDRFLSTFKVKIYKKINNNWKLIQDKYTPDFLIIKRTKKNKIDKTLIIETKGAHLAQDFSAIKEFMENKFIEINPNKYSFLYLEDGKEMKYQIQQINDKIRAYFI